ncbi:MAG: M20/M25/M40 family metallo-hydrolase [Chloroflexi bacterium]|nr:M20/M25/M40 family metallo-hydrolase [Chloroflexota bacterium]
MHFDIDPINDYLESNRERFLDEFRQLIAIPSVAAQKRGIHECADWVMGRLRQLGAEVQQFALPNDGSPVIVGEIGAGERVLLVYNHYDVQPEAPLDLWDSPPFELTRRDGKLFGRGTNDDKGELLARIQAVEAWRETYGELPLRIKFIFEGEEEIGSVNLPGWAESQQELLQGDGLLWEGGGYDEADRIIMAEGCKGIAYFELRCRGAAYDLHSSLAPMIVNPAWRLVWALNTMKDSQDRITVDGFIDHIRPMPQPTIDRIDALPFESERMRANFGLSQWLNAMEDETALRQYYLAPTMTICGLESGYTDAGTKTVLPAQAMAKIDCRLVPDLTPEIVQDLIRKHLDARGFEDIELVPLAGEHPAMDMQDSQVRRAAIAASQAVFGQDPVIVPWFAGSGPMYPLSTQLGIPVISAGATWHPGGRAHAPNENIFEEDYFAAIRFMAVLIDRFAAMK